MDHKNAIKLLDDTFNQDFNLERFSQFIKELFNHFNLSINKDIPLRKEYYDYIDQMDSLGVYKDNNRDSIEVFAVKLKKTSSRDRARTMQRNLVAKYLKISGSNAALVAFYGEDPQDWRFSFVKIEYDLIKNEKGNLKVKEEITPAKRYSFLVGKNEPNHTCRRQFLSLIKEEDTDPLLEQIEEAFSIESVTKEFFEEYKKLFLKLNESLEQVIEKDDVVKKEFKKKSIPTADFAKKLMGQIVFIYFLQKKGWLGVDKGDKWGKGPKKFLIKLFDQEMTNYDNFFNEILEPLFYEALATERDEEYYSRFNCRIPFLNGGLFEPMNDYDWIGTDITLKNEIFKEILDTFDLFNFTVKEDEPLEKEVAVDPEMLGKVFENLLEVTDRKSKGAFYTPREIVHYMCQQSLVNYLETNSSNLSKTDIEKFIFEGDFALDSIIREQEQKKTYQGRIFQKQILPESIKENSGMINQLLKDIKVVDPAVGSGAFPVGMMNEIVRARSILSLLSEKETKTYDLKRETIENSLYGVDIDSSAVDITKLRFWLSLVVDEDDIQNIKPLPNLDHKIMCGNSLIEEFEGMRLLDENLLEVPKINPEIEKISAQKEHLEKELEQLRCESPKNIDKITTIDNKISKIRKKIKKIISKTNDKSQASLFASEAQKKLKLLEKKQYQFFNAESPNKKKKLRKEIESIEWEFIEETLKFEGNEKSINKIQEYKKNKSKPFFIWKLYFAEVFQRDNPGFDIVIANPPYVRMERIKELKPYLKNNYEVYASRADIYTYFFEKGINILNNHGILTFICSNKFTRANYGKNLRKLILKNQLIKYNDYPGIKIFEDATVDPCTIFIKKEIPSQNHKVIINESQIPQNRLDEHSWSFEPPELIDLKDRIYNKSNKLEDIPEVKIFWGVRTGYNNAFIINEKEKDALIKKDIINKRIIRPLIRGRDVEKYGIYYRNYYVILVKKGDGITLKNEYPTIYWYLKQFEEKLKNRGQVKNGQHHWLELDNNPKIEFIEEFKKLKIVWSDMSKSPSFVIDTNGYYTLNTTYFITSADNYNLYYLTGLLNSELHYWIFKQLASNLGESGLRYFKQFVNKLPIYPANNLEQDILANEVISILESNKKLINEVNSFIRCINTDLGIDKLSRKLENYYYLSFPEFMKELKNKKIAGSKNESIIKERFENSLHKVITYLTEIKRKEKRINEIVYNLYGLNNDEIKLIKKSLNGEI